MLSFIHILLLFWGNSSGDSKAVEVTNRINAENQARNMGVPGPSGYRTPSGVPNVGQITRDVAKNKAYNGPTHGGNYIVKNRVPVKWE